MSFSKNSVASTTQNQQQGAPAMNTGTYSIASAQSMPPQQMFNLPQSQVTGPPNWVSELIEDVKHIKLSMTKLDQIERTVNTINMKVSDLEMKVNSIEPRVTEVEKSCSFISYENDIRKKEVEGASAEVHKLKSDCANMQADTNYLRARNANLEAKVTDLESRSMRDNLLFYGVSERGQLENCESLVKEVCIETLDLPEALDMKFDRVHRVGTFSNNKVRPIVAKFHNFKDREIVRQKAFETNETLKRSNLGIGQQWPAEVRETRKALYPIMQRKKAQGKEVRLVKDKLFVNNVQYKLTPQEQYQSQNSAPQTFQPRYRTQNPGGGIRDMCNPILVGLCHNSRRRADGFRHHHQFRQDSQGRISGRHLYTE